MNIDEPTTTNSLLKIFAVLCIAFFVVLPLYIKSKIYYPSKQYADIDSSYEDVYITTSDGVKINAWYSAPIYRSITVVFCHGNGGNLSYYQEIFGYLRQKGYGVLAIDYRGYGKSEGKPGEAGLYKDLRASIKYLNDEKRTPKSNIVLWGLSLGGGVVSKIASEDPAYRGIILQSTFTNLNGMVKNVVATSGLPVISNVLSGAANFVPMIDKYDTMSRISQIKSPLMIAHAVPDDVVPVEMSRELAKQCPNAHVFISETGSHNEYDWFYPKAFKFLELLERAGVRK